MYLSNVDCAVGGYVHTSLMWTVLPWWGAHVFLGWIVLVWGYVPL